jgi:REP element-mobilizing transposase RayT
MTRPLRLQFPGALFHVISRGNARKRIFFDDRDRRFFLDLLSECVGRFDWILPAYSLMPNHFHLMVQLTTETLSKGMQWLNSSYAIAFNRRHKRVGHVLQGRYKSPLVQKELYLLRLARYIVLNPVRAGIVMRPEDDRWSSYRATIGVTPPPKWLAIDDVLLPFGPRRDVARAAFRDFVNAAIGIDSGAWKDLVGRSYIGSCEWIAEVEERVRLEPRSREHPIEQREPIRRSMIDVVAAVAQTYGIDEARIQCGIDRTPRMLAAWVAWNGGLLNGREIGDGLRLTRGRVSQLVRNCDRALERDPRLRAALSTIGRKLNIKDLTPAS